MTGFMAVDALECVKGAELKLEEMGYQIDGRKVEWIKEDYASDPVKSVDKARKLIEHDKVDVILGPLNDASGFAVADHAAKSGTPNITFHSHVREVAEVVEHRELAGRRRARLHRRRRCGALRRLDVIGRCQSHVLSGKGADECSSAPIGRGRTP